MTSIQAPVVMKLEQVVKYYGKTEKPSLGPVSLELHQGEVVGIRGINGSGKSTLLKAAAGAIRISEGKRIIAKETEGKIGYVPQDLSLYESLTCYENLCFWGILQGVPRKAVTIRADWLLEQFHLKDKRDENVETCSGGMKRRLHLATALMVTPSVLLLDEPSVGADEESRNTIDQMILHEKKMGTGVLLVSHEKGELENVCDRILSMHDGLLTEGNL